MCRNIRPLFNFDPPATPEEIESASLQFVRKLVGTTKPSKINEETFYSAVKTISKDVETLFVSLATNAEPKNREIEAERRRIQSLKRFGN